MPMDRYYTQVMRVAVIDSMEGRIVAECVREHMAEAICTMLNDTVKPAPMQQPAADPPEVRHMARMARLIDDLELSVRSVNALTNDGMDTVGDIVKRSKRDLMGIPNIGKRSVQEIEEVLLDMGLRLSPIGINHSLKGAS